MSCSNSRQSSCPVRLRQIACALTRQGDHAPGARELVEALDRPPRRDAQAAAALALVSRERHQQDHGALEEVAVVVLAGAPGREDHRARAPPPARARSRAMVAAPTPVMAAARSGRVVASRCSRRRSNRGRTSTCDAVGELDLVAARRGRGAARRGPASVRPSPQQPGTVGERVLRLVPEVEELVAAALRAGPTRAGSARCPRAPGSADRSARGRTRRRRAPPR